MKPAAYPRPASSDRAAKPIAAPPWFWSACRRNGLYVSAEQVRLLEYFVGLLVKWNSKINLISKRDEEKIWENHILHSLSLLFCLEIPNAVKILDLGTGGGLPGIPLKIVRPDLSFLLLDATNKKVEAVNFFLHSLNLSGIQALWGRAEELGKRPQHSGKYDLVLARAVASLKDLIRWSQPFLVKDLHPEKAGHSVDPSRRKVKVYPPALLAFKGGELETEIQKARAHPGIRAVLVQPLVFAGGERLQGSDKKVVYVQF